VLLLVTYPLAIAVAVWQLGGIWRSASKHKSSWATLAKVAVIIGVLRCCVLVATTYIPQGKEMASIIAGDTRLPSYNIRLLPGGTEIVFRGGLRAGCAEELERILSAAPQVKVLHIESPGGRINEAKRIGQLVRQRGLTTYTSGYCLSAATLVLMSGKERVVAPGAKVGFHQGTLPGATAVQRLIIDSLVRATMHSAGVSDEFTERVLATPSNQMWYPTFEEMREARVLTSQSYSREGMGNLPQSPPFPTAPFSSSTKLLRIDSFTKSRPARPGKGKSEDRPDYIKRLEEWDVKKPLSPDHGLDPRP
jgi:hypothetical protein